MGKAKAPQKGSKPPSEVSREILSVQGQAGGSKSSAATAAEPKAGDDLSDEGSSLGSDLDDDELYKEPETKNLLTGELTKVQKVKKGWKLQFRRGFLAVDGIECLFSTLQGTFDLPECN